MTTDTCTRVAVYTRTSLDKTGEGLGVTRQRQDCLRLIDQRGWELTLDIEDNDTSATYGTRSGFERLLKAMETGQVDVVVVWHLDRLLRKMTDLERVIEVVERTKINVVTISGDLNLNNDMGRMVGRILASVARGEIERKSARHKRANQQRAESGLPHKGRRAFGYRSDGMSVDEDEALALKELVGKFISGWSYDDLATWLNDNGYRTTMSNPFYGVAVRQMLQRVRYNGLREHDGVTYKAQWPAIFDDDTWRLIQHTARARSEKRGNKPMPRKFLLTGLVHCGACGASMNGTTTYDRRTGEPRKTYRCNRQRLGTEGLPGCGKVSRGSVPLEWFLREVIAARLDTPDLSRLLADGSDSAILSEVLAKREVLTARKNALVDDYADGTLDRAGFKRAVSRVQAALSAVQAEVDQLSAPRFGELLSPGESVMTRWDVETDGWRRQLIELLVESITVLPGRALPDFYVEDKRFRFAPELIRVDWKA